MKQTTKALLAVFCGNTIFGFSFLASRIILEKYSVFTLLSARFILAFAVMNLLILLKVFTVNFKNKNIFPLILLGACQPVIYFICESYGIKLTNSSFSGTLIAMVPIFAFFFAAAMLGEKLSVKALLWGICSVAGVVIISLGGSADGEVTLPGILLLVGAVITGALFNVLSRKASARFSPFERTYVMFALSAVVFTVLSLAETKGKTFSAIAAMLRDRASLPAMLFLSVCSSVIAFMLLNYATTYITVRQTSIFSCLTTVISIIAGIVFLHEPFGGLRQIIGSALIIIGVYMVSIGTAQGTQDSKNA